MRLHGVMQSSRTKQVLSALLNCDTLHTLTLSMAAELYTVQDALQALCGLQLMHPSALLTPQVLCMMLTLLRLTATMCCR